MNRTVEAMVDDKGNPLKDHVMFERPGFKEKKTCQLSAYLLHLAGGKMDTFTLIKLLYLIDREALKRWGRAITFDNYVSMPHGPVLSKTYDLIKGKTHSALWSEYFSEWENGFYVCLVNDNPDFGALSRAERNLTKMIFNIYGQMNFRQLYELGHSLEEWEDPAGSVRPIQIERILQAVGKTEDEIKAICEEMHSEAYAEKVFG